MTEFLETIREFFALLRQLVSLPIGVARGLFAALVDAAEDVDPYDRAAFV